MNSHEPEMLLFEEAGIEIVDGDRGVNYPKQSDFSSEGFCLFLNTGNTPGEGFDFSGCQFITEHKDAQLRKGRLKRNDIVLTTRGTIGNVALYDSSILFEHLRINSGMVLLRCDQERLLAPYLYIFLRSPDFRKQVEALRSGAAQPQLPIRDIKRILIRVPSMAVQRAICAVVSAYDDLIAANKRRIALLEDAARRLYREWFVYLRFPGHELVPVKDGTPEGWRKAPISEQTLFLNRGIAPKYDDSAKGCVINQKCIRDGWLTMQLARRQSKEVKQDRLVQVGDVLINSTGAGTLGRVAQVRASIENCTVDTHVTIARPVDEISATYFGQALLNLEPVFSEMGRGATNQLELSRADIGAIEVLVPAPSVCMEFHRLGWPMLEQAEKLRSANQSLVNARDLLLPKLMSGQLNVSTILLPDQLAVDRARGVGGDSPLEANKTKAPARLVA